MSCIVNFAHLSAGYFCVLIHLLYLCSGVQLGCLEIVRAFLVLLLRESKAVLSLRIIISYYWGKTLLCPLPNACASKGFPVWLMGTDSIPSSIRARGTATSNFFRWLFPYSCRISSHVCVLLWDWNITYYSNMLRKSTQKINIAICIG